MKKLLMILVVSLLLVGCGNTDTTDNAQGTEEQQTQQTQKQEETHTHAYAESITTEATCETDGLKTFTCECGDSYTEVITATGHIYENYVSNNDATYLADGTETATCVCGLTDTRTAEGSKLEYTYTDLDKTMYAKQSVNVRDLPTADGNKLGGLSSAQEVKVTGQCNETSWYRIEFDGNTGYVSDSYLQNDKPAQQTTTQNTSSGNWYDGYAFDVWLDMGEYYMYLSYSKDAAIAAPQTDHDARFSTLRSRYPDANVYEMGCDYGGGVYGSVMSISRGETGTSSWYRPHFPWE